MPLSSATRYSEYDAFARIHRESWGPELRQWLPDIEKFIRQHLPENIPTQPKILDLCCGTGELAQGLHQKGYQVTGLDGSEEMLRYARQNSPDSEFILDDARFFKLPPTFHGVISTTYGLNHVITIEELTSVFRNVYAALLSNGVFIFDLKLDEFYRASWHNSVLGDIKDEYVWTMSRCYNSQERLGHIKTAIFQILQNQWQRSNLTWQVKGYFQDEIEFALQDVGFKNIHVYDVERDFKQQGCAGITYIVGYK
jgi:ubiquinone/menaquinone biosynthesis C-methylase UbiE